MDLVSVKSIALYTVVLTILQAIGFALLGYAWQFPAGEPDICAAHMIQGAIHPTLLCLLPVIYFSSSIILTVCASHTYLL